MTHQCPSCGGICKKSGCERANVEETTDEYLLHEAWLCIEELGNQLLHDGVPTAEGHPKRVAINFAGLVSHAIGKRLEGW